MINLYKEINSKYGDALKAVKFNDIYYSCDNRCFGNSVLEYESKDLRLRFVKDRGILRIEIDARKGESWIDLKDVINYFRESHSLTANSNDSVVILCDNISVFNQEFSKKKYVNLRLKLLGKLGLREDVE